MNLKLLQPGTWALAALAAGGCFSAQGQQTNGPAIKPFSAFQIISERNIFDPNRRPRVTYTPRPAPRIVDSFSLAGTMTYSNVVLAIFDGTGSDYHKALEVEGKIAGFTVMEINQDYVKLQSGTNQVELKVGMQMRRNQNGMWSAAEATEMPSYASNSRFENSDRGGRRFYSRRNGFGFNQANGNTGQPTDTSAPGTDIAAGSLSSNGGNLDTNDPVARLMLRRLQETGGPVNQGGDVNQNEGGPPGGDPNGPPENPGTEPNPPDGNP